MDQHNYEEARHVVFRSGKYAWATEGQYNKYKQGMASNAYGSTARYIDFWQPSHVGINRHIFCNSCKLRHSEHHHLDMVAIEVFPNTPLELNSEITRLLSGTFEQDCDLLPDTERNLNLVTSVDEDIDEDLEADMEHWRAVEESLKSHYRDKARRTRKQQSCPGRMEVKCRLTHLGKYMIVKQACIKEAQRRRNQQREVKKKRKSTIEKSTLLFTELSWSDFEIAGMNAEVKCVILCDGGHFRAAVATRDGRWIAHDGLHGWCVGNHGDTDFGLWFQSGQFQIALIIYELKPGLESNIQPQNLEDPCVELKLNVSALAWQCKLKMSRVIWNEMEAYTTGSISLAGLPVQFPLNTRS